MNRDKFSKYLEIANAISKFSKDPSTKVGAIAINDKGIILSTGYNGFPRGVNDDAARYENREVKYKLISHAEQNLVAQAAYAGHSLRGSTVFLSGLFPCSSCAKSLIQAGVSTIISPPPDKNDRWKDDAEWSKILLDEAQVETIYVEEID